MLSAKQQAVSGHAFGDGFLCLSVGTVRSGKTHSATRAFTRWTLALERPYKHLILGRKLRVIESELLPHVAAAAEPLGYSYNRSEHILRIRDQSYHLVAGNDVRSADMVTGLTCHSALIDEATLLPETFWDMALARLSFPDSKAWSACNPGGPLHWLKKGWIDEGKVDTHFDFDFADNPSLTPEAVERYRSLYSGVFQKRMIAGMWSAAEGLVYPDAVVEERDTKTRGRVVVGVDYGGSAPNVLCVLVQTPNGYHCPASEEHRGVSDNVLADEILRLDGLWQGVEVAVPADAASLRYELRARGIRAFKARQRVLEGIRRVGAAFASGRLTVSPRAKGLVRELATYAWDPRREDAPVKEHDHHCDALRYAYMRMERSGIRVLPNPYR